MRVKDLTLGAGDVSVVALVLSTYPVNRFTSEDGAEGRVARPVVCDDTGTVNVVLWNEKTEIAARGRISLNQVVRVSHDYVREGLDGSPELNLGRIGKIVVLSLGPPVSGEETAGMRRGIGDLEEGDEFVSFTSVVMSVSRASSFRREDGGLGLVVRLRLADNTGKIRGVFGDDKADYVKEYSRGDALLIRGGRVKRGLGGALEVHVGSLGRVKRLREGELPYSLSPTLTRIGDLRVGMSDIDVLGRVVSVVRVREFERASEDLGRVGSLFLMDDTDSVRLTLWDEGVEALTEVSPGDVVLVEGGYTLKGLGGWWKYTSVGWET